MIARQVLSVLIPISLAAVWILFVPPLLFRLFGISLPLNPWKRRRIKLSLAQGVFLTGILSYGAAIFIATATLEYFDWKLTGGSPAPLNSGRLIFHFFLWPALGAFYGWAVYPWQGKGPATKHPPS